MGISRRWKRRLALLATTALIACAPSAAHADPITAAVVGLVNVIGGATVAAAVGNFLVAYGAAIYATAASWALGKLSAPKVASASQERQAQVTSLTLGEVPREMIVGRAATGGSLVDAYYYGGDNGTDWNLFVVALADHPCDALEGFYVNDTYVPFTGDGEVAGYNGQLKVYWRPGEADDVGFPVDIIGLGPATAPGNLLGVAKVVVAYKADAPDSKNPTWSAGRPQFLWVVRGARVYDPREDDTVPGGEGPQRYNDRTTWTWSENAELNRYAFNRGAYAFNDWWDHNRLRVGRGLSEYEAPPVQVIPAANLCDELVDIGDGQTEPRYRVGGVIRANESFDRVEQMFADAMGGFIIQPEGGVAVDPGQAKTPVAMITDDDLLATEQISFTPFRSASDRVNTVVARYIEPSQKFADTAAGVMRDTDDIALDGGPLEEVMSLPLVQSRKQAERLAEHRRRQHRLERLASFTLGPRFAHLEEGDWIEWRSRRWGNEPVLFRITAYALDMAWRNTLSVEETAFEVFGFGGTYTPIVDQEPTIPPGALALADVEAEAISLIGANGELVPAVQFTWAAPVDPAIERVRAEIRRVGQTEIASTPTDEVGEGVLIVSNGVPPSASIQARLVPVGVPGRSVAEVPWQTLSTDALVATDTMNFGGLTPADITKIKNDLAALARAALLQIIQAQTTARADLDDALDKVRDVLDGKPLAPVIVEQKEVLADVKVETGENTAAIAAEVVARETAVSSEAALRIELETEYEGNKATVLSGLVALATEDEAIASSVLELTATVDDNMATVQDSLTAMATTDSALAASVTTLTATVGSNKAAADASLLVLSDADKSLASQITTLTTTVGNNKASAESNLASLSTTVSAVSSSVTTLSATVGSNKSSVDASLVALSNADSSMSSQISALTTTVGNNKSSADASLSTLTTNVSSLSGSFTTLSATVGSNKSSADASLSTLSSGQSTQAGQITTLQSNAASLSATVSTNASTLADVVSKVAVARFTVEAVASGGRPARLALTSDSLGGSNIALSAAKVYFGDNTVFDDASDTLRTEVGGAAYIMAWGAAFGVDSDLLIWLGPAGVGYWAASRANAYFYLAKTTPYLGGSAVPSGGGGGGFTVDLSTPLVTGNRFGVGSATTDAVAVTTSGGEGSVTYSWASQSGSTFTVSNAAADYVDFTGNLTSLGQTLDGFWRVTARDAAGHVAFADVRVIVQENS